MNMPFASCLRVFSYIILASVAALTCGATWFCYKASSFLIELTEILASPGSRVVLQYWPEDKLLSTCRDAGGSWDCVTLPFAGFIHMANTSHTTRGWLVSVRDTLIITPGSFKDLVEMIIVYVLDYVLLLVQQMGTLSGKLFIEGLTSFIFGATSSVLECVKSVKFWIFLFFFLIVLLAVTCIVAAIQWISEKWNGVFAKSFTLYWLGIRLLWKIFSKSISLIVNILLLPIPSKFKRQRKIQSGRKPSGIGKRNVVKRGRKEKAIPSNRIPELTLSKIGGVVTIETELGHVGYGTFVTFPSGKQAFITAAHTILDRQGETEEVFYLVGRQGKVPLNWEMFSVVEPVERDLLILLLNLGDKELLKFQSQLGFSFSPASPASAVTRGPVSIKKKNTTYIDGKTLENWVMASGSILGPVDSGKSFMHNVNTAPGTSGAAVWRGNMVIGVHTNALADIEANEAQAIPAIEDITIRKKLKVTNLDAAAEILQESFLQNMLRGVQETYSSKGGSVWSEPPPKLSNAKTINAKEWFAQANAKAAADIKAKGKKKWGDYSDTSSTSQPQIRRQYEGETSGTKGMCTWKISGPQTEVSDFFCSIHGTGTFNFCNCQGDTKPSAETINKMKKRQRRRGRGKKSQVSGVGVSGNDTGRQEGLPKQKPQNSLSGSISNTGKPKEKSQGAQGSRQPESARNSTTPPHMQKARDLSGSVVMIDTTKYKRRSRGSAGPKPAGKQN